MDVLEKKSFYKELAALAVPLALQALLHALVGATDALMLGRLNQESVAAVALANQVSFVMSLFNGAITGAFGVLIAQYYGKGDRENAKRFMSMAIRYAFGISAVFFLPAILIPERLMRIFTPEPELIRIGASYLKIVGFSYVFSGISQVYLMMMKIGGRAKISVWISAVTVAVDMAADFFLIYGVGRLPALGADGAAYSTVVVESVALLWCLLEAGRKDHIRPDRKSLFFFSKQCEADVWRIAPSMLASSLSWGLSISVHSLIMGHLGTDATAAASVTAVARQLIQCFVHGLSGGAGVMIGGLLGRNELEKAKRYGRRFWSVATFAGLLSVAVLAIVGPLVTAFYLLEPTAKAYLIRMLVFSALYVFAYSYNTIIVCGVFPAGGDAKYDAVSVFFATWCFAIPLSLLGCFVFRWPVMLIYIVMCADEIVKVPFIIPRYKKYLWVKNLTVETGE
ncbi:MAG: MATE family efflux transporter [Christensenellales bacterium]|jgi:putative MATE family efflux protein